MTAGHARKPVSSKNVESAPRSLPGRGVFGPRPTSQARHGLLIDQVTDLHAANYGVYGAAASTSSCVAKE